MSISPQNIDLLIIMGVEIFKILGKISKGETITDEDLNLESFEYIFNKIKKDLGKE